LHCGAQVAGISIAEDEIIYDHTHHAPLVSRSMSGDHRNGLDFSNSVESSHVASAGASGGDFRFPPDFLFNIFHVLQAMGIIKEIAWFIAAFVCLIVLFLFCMIWHPRMTFGSIIEWMRGVYRDESGKVTQETKI